MIKRRIINLETKCVTTEPFEFRMFYKDDDGTIRDEEGNVCEPAGNAIILKAGCKP